MVNQELSKESELKEGKNEKKRKRDLPRRWEQDMLYLQKSKTGEPTVPREAQKTPLQKEGMGCEEGAAKKVRKKEEIL